MHLDGLLQEIADAGVKIESQKMPRGMKGLYGENLIWINSRIRSHVGQACILAEELGHHLTSSGDIIDQRDVRNRKQERRARGWAFTRLIPIKKIIQAHEHGIRNRHELAVFMCVTEDFLTQAIKYYADKYGLSVTIGQRTVIFEPLGVMDLFDFYPFTG